MGGDSIQASEIDVFWYILCRYIDTFKWFYVVSYNIFRDTTHKGHISN